MAYYAGANREEVKERFYQYLYYSGTGEKDLAQAMSEGRFAIMAALVRDRTHHSGADREPPAGHASKRRAPNLQAIFELHQVIFKTSGRHS